MKHQKIQINKRLIGTILMGAGLAIIMLLAFNLAVMAGMLAPPQVVEISPANGSHNAGVDAPISITYDQAMDPATVNPQSFVVHAMQTGWLTETLHVDGGMIVLQPTSPLHAGELVQVTATTATLSLEGEAPLEPTVWQFTTAPWGGNAVFHFSQFIADSTGQEGAMADLNQDGFPDVITVNWIGNVRIFHNDGHGQFNEAQYLSFPGYNLVGSAVGDLDGDGDLDAVLIDNTNHDNRVLWNNGDGKFTDGGPAFWSSHDWTARLGDVDGDGDLDVIVVSGGIDNTGTARTWRNDGEGHFSLLEEFDAREILHVTFGSVLTARKPDGSWEFYDRFMALLRSHPEAYAANLETHFLRHLRPFVSSR